MGSFSGFDSKMLLRETEKSISSDMHLYETHEELIDLEKEILESDTNLQAIQNRAETLQIEVNRLEREKKLMEEREKFMKQLKLLQQKMAWVKFEERRQIAVELRQERKTLKAELTKAREKVDPIREEIGEIKQDLNRNTQRKNALAKVINSSKRQYESELKKGENCMDTIDGLKVDLTDIDANHRRKKNKVLDRQKQLEDAEAVYNSFVSHEVLEKAHRDAHQEQKESREKINLIKRELQRHQE